MRFFSVLAASSLLLTCPSLGAEAKERPNIILLMADDQGWEEMAYNGHPYLKTPALDEMAASGLRMDRFYSASSVCSPTRGSVLTGRHANRYGAAHAGCSIRPEEITIAHILREAGYATGHFGKWHLGPVKASSPTNPGNMGFDEWLSHDNFFEMDPVLSRNGGDPEVHEGEGSEIMIDETIRFIGKAQDAGKPFFAVVWFGSPHQPYSALEEDLALYDDLPEKYAEEMAPMTSLETGDRIKIPLRDLLQARFAEITAMDRAIGKLRTHLENEGIRNNTMLWYTSDNGLPLEGKVMNPGLRMHKATVYEGGIRVPAIIEWPDRIPTPSATSVTTVTSDMLPTICGLLDLPLPKRPIDGINLEPLLDGTMLTRPEPLNFWIFMSNIRDEKVQEQWIDKELQKGTTPTAKKLGGRFTRNFANFCYNEILPEDYMGPAAVIDGRHKIVLTKPDNVVELYDIVDDPFETRDIAALYPDLVKRMLMNLSDWQSSVLHSLMGRDYIPYTTATPEDQGDHR
jgi:arylsulfatase A-like enzyme